jgi:hypothetical protein
LEINKQKTSYIVEKRRGGMVGEVELKAIGMNEEMRK